MKSKNIKLRYLQHERLVHLLVTLTFGIVFIITTELGLVFQNSFLGLIGIGLGILLICYVVHYFKLENEVQKRY